MNIDEYRAMVAQEKETGGVEGAQTEQVPTATPQEVVQETPQVQSVPEPATVETPVEEVPSVIKYNDEEYKVEELVQYRYEAEALRQQQQQIQAQLQQAQIAKQYYDKLMEDPEYAKAFAQNNGLQFLDPKEQAVKELESRYNDLLLQREIENMQIKYNDFNPAEVVKFALERQVGNLEDAYLLQKAHTAPQTNIAQPIDVASLTQQIRQEVLNELQSNVDTASVIGTSGSGGKPIQQSAPELTAQELKIAQGLSMTPQEYAKWKNVK